VADDRCHLNFRLRWHRTLGDAPRIESAIASGGAAMNLSAPVHPFQPNSRFRWLLLSFPIALVVAIGVLVPVVGLNAFAKLVSFLAVLASIALGIFAAPAGMAVLIALGRTDLGRYASGFVDLSFWITFGLLAAVILSGRRLNLRALGIVPILSCCSFAVIVAASYLDNTGYDYPRDKAGRILLYLVVYVFFTAFLIADVRRLRLFLVSILGLAHIAGAVAVLNAIQTSGLANLQRLTLPGSGPVTLARLLGLASIIALGMSFSMNRGRRNMLRIDALFLLALVFLTGSRAPALFLGFSLVMLLIIQNVSSQPRHRWTRLVFIMLVFVFASSLVRPLLTNSNIPALRRFDLLFQQDRGVSVDARTKNYQLALEGAKDQHYRGLGVGSWAFLTNDGNSISYPHNIFLETLYEMGAIGLLFLLIFLLSTGWRSVRSIRGPDHSWFSPVLAVLLLFSLLAAQTSGDLFDNRYVFFFGLLAGGQLDWAGDRINEDKIHRMQSGSPSTERMESGNCGRALGRS
jgi:O-antigen ligase